MDGRRSNGWLSRREVEGEVTEANVDTFNRIDSNNDNRVSRTEWLYSRASFDCLDTNKDSFLTRREMAGTNVNDGTLTANVEVGGTSNESRWTDTGVYVYAGDMVRFQASGVVYMTSGTDDAADPRGSRSGRHAGDSPLPNQLAGTLIGRIDNGAPFVVGDRNTAVRMPRAGRLYLSVNDDHLGDNHGSFRVGRLPVDGRHLGAHQAQVHAIWPRWCAQWVRVSRITWKRGASSTTLPPAFNCHPVCRCPTVVLARASRAALAD